MSGLCGGIWLRSRGRSEAMRREQESSPPKRTKKLAILLMVWLTSTAGRGCDSPTAGCPMLDWRELCRLSDEELANFDIAELNLACARGLPGMERFDFDRCLAII